MICRGVREMERRKGEFFFFFGGGGLFFHSNIFGLTLFFFFFGKRVWAYTINLAPFHGIKRGKLH